MKILNFNLETLTLLEQDLRSISQDTGEGKKFLNGNGKHVAQEPSPIINSTWNKTFNTEKKTICRAHSPENGKKSLPAMLQTGEGIQNL